MRPFVCGLDVTKHWKGIMVYFFSASLIISTIGQKCDEIHCSNIFDEVCGVAEVKNSTPIKLIYQNLCYMRKAACEEESFVEVNQVENEVCGLEKTNRDYMVISVEHQDKDNETRRVADFSIVGSHQACQHTCPVACTDTYEPACAVIWNNNMLTFTLKTMLNHCHIDMFSCATGLNVTIDNLNRCLSNALKMQLPFIKSAAAMKSLGLITDDLNDNAPQKGRRTDVAPPVENEKTSLKNHLKEVVRRIFDKYRKVN